MVDRGTLDINKDLSFVDPRIRSQAPVDRMVLLPHGFTPTNWDVICQRGKDSYEHIGNRRFRVCIENNLERYAEAKTKLDKSLIVMSIVDNIREASKSHGGGFVKQDLTTGRWYEVGDKLAREKVGQALREAIKQRNQPRSESPSSQHASGSDCDDRKEPSSASSSYSMKKPSAKGGQPQRRLSSRDRELLFKTFDEKNTDPEDSKPNSKTQQLQQKLQQQQHQQTKKKRQRNSDPSLKLPRIIDTDMKMLPYLKQKDSDESGSLSDLIGASALFTGQQDSMSVSSSIFSATDDIELNEPNYGEEETTKIASIPGEGRSSSSSRAAAEFDLAGLRQQQHHPHTQQERKKGIGRSTSSPKQMITKKKSEKRSSSTKFDNG